MDKYLVQTEAQARFMKRYLQFMYMMISMMTFINIQQKVDYNMSRNTMTQSVNLKLIFPRCLDGVRTLGAVASCVLVDSDDTLGIFGLIWMYRSVLNGTSRDRYQCRKN